MVVVEENVDDHSHNGNEHKKDVQHVAYLQIIVSLGLVIVTGIAVYTLVYNYKAYKNYFKAASSPAKIWFLRSMVALRNLP